MRTRKPTSVATADVHPAEHGEDVYPEERSEDFHPAECNEDAVYPTEQSEGAEAD